MVVVDFSVVFDTVSWASSLWRISAAYPQMFCSGISGARKPIGRWLTLGHLANGKENEGGGNHGGAVVGHSSSNSSKLLNLYHCILCLHTNTQ